jgi:hypothetical protein
LFEKTYTLYEAELMLAELFKQVCIGICHQMRLSSNFFETSVINQSQECRLALHSIFPSTLDTLARQSEEDFVPGGKHSRSPGGPSTQHQGTKALEPSGEREGNDCITMQPQQSRGGAGKSLQLRAFLESSGFTRCPLFLLENAMLRPSGFTVRLQVAKILMHLSCTEGMSVLCRESLLQECISAQIAFDMIEQQPELASTHLTLVSIAKMGPEVCINEIMNPEASGFAKLRRKLLPWFTSKGAKVDGRGTILKDLNEKAWELLHRHEYEEPSAEVLKSCAQRVWERIVSDGDVKKNIISGTPPSSHKVIRIHVVCI